MAANEPLTAADLQAGTRVATERGRSDARSASEFGERERAAFSTYRKNLRKADRARTAGDIGALAGFLAPEALKAIGVAAGGDVKAERAVSAGLASRAQVAGKPAPVSFGQSLVGAGEQLGRDRGRLAAFTGTLAGDPSMATLGGLSALSGIQERRRFAGPELEDVERLRELDRRTASIEALRRR